MGKKVNRDVGSPDVAGQISEYEDEEDATA
jgi:hypothetical protein